MNTNRHCCCPFFELFFPKIKSKLLCEPRTWHEKGIHWTIHKYVENKKNSVGSETFGAINLCQYPRKWNLKTHKKNQFYDLKNIARLFYDRRIWAGCGRLKNMFVVFQDEWWSFSISKLFLFKKVSTHKLKQNFLFSKFWLFFVFQYQTVHPLTFQDFP